MAGDRRARRGLSTVDGMLIAAVVIWAFNITVTKYVLTHGFRPLSYATIRYGAATLLFVGLTVALERSLAVGGRRNLGLLGFASLMLCLNQFAFVYSLKLASATTVALILGTTPIFTALISVAVGEERPTRRHWLAAVVTFGGVALVALGSGGDISSDLGGDLLAVGLAATWAAYSVTLAPLMRRYSPYRISTVVLAAMMIPLAAVSAPQLGEQSYGSLPALDWLGLAFAVVGPLVLTNVLWYKAVDRVGPTRAALVGNLQPFIGAIFAGLILSEPLHPLQGAGGALILAGILIERRPAPSAREPAEP